MPGEERWPGAAGWARVREWSLCPDKPQEGDPGATLRLSRGLCVNGAQEAASGLFGETRLPTVD